MIVRPPTLGLETDGPLHTRTRPIETLYDLATEQRLYAIVDTAGDAAAYAQVLALGARARCLYFGAEGARYAAIAPWLVQADARVCDWICTVLQPAAPDWGVFVVSRADPAPVGRQLRRWLTVRLEDGEAVRFRFYDPRVLFDYLSACSGDELRAFYGAPIEAFVHYDAPTRDLWIYAHADTVVRLPARRVTITAADDADVAAPTPPTLDRAVAPFPLGLAGHDR